MCLRHEYLPVNEHQETWPILDYFINIITSYLRILTSDVMLQFRRDCTSGPDASQSEAET
jgi:hypothetical protein